MMWSWNRGCQEKSGFMDLALLVTLVLNPRMMEDRFLDWGANFDTQGVVSLLLNLFSPMMIIA